MNRELVKAKLIAVLQSIQSDSGYSEKQISGATCPLCDLEGFDSLICPVAIGMLSAELGVEIPNNKNIFLSEDGKLPLTLDESVGIVCKIAHIGEK